MPFSSYCLFGRDRRMWWAVHTKLLLIATPGQGDVSWKTGNVLGIGVGEAIAG